MEILQGLNPAQQEAVTSDGKPLLILAGAGSGKTKVLTHRAAYLVEKEGVDPENVLLLTFTNKAAEEMMRRVESLLRGKGWLGKTRVRGGTFHSFCARTLREYAEAAGLSPAFVIFDSGDQLDVVKQAMGVLGVDAKTVKPGSILGTISGAKNELIGPSEYAGFVRGDWQQTTAKIYGVYQQLLRKFKALDFDDLLVEAVRLLINRPDVLEMLQERYRFILVDEYQDTNKAQYELTKLLSKKYLNLTVVGDAAQAIYSWRGANYRNLLFLKQDFPDLRTLNLEQNYRSTGVILNAANKVISKNKNHPVLNLWTNRGDGEKIVLFEAESELDEARYVIDVIREGVRKRGETYRDFAVLYRTNAQSRVLEEAFLHAGIPYSLVGGVRFYERKEIKDVLAYLHLVVNPENEVAKRRAEKNGKTRLARLQDSSFTPQIPNLNSLEILDRVLKATGYLDLFDESNEEDAARLENIKELRSVAAQYPGLPDFLENIALTEKEAKTGFRIQDSGFNKGGVTLMTLHAAKGLEFKNVFMVGMEEGLFPHSRTLANPEELEEERRLCYVGMTRAMDRLSLTYAVRRLYFGQRNSGVVSRFLGDIPEEYLDMTTNGFRPASSFGKLGTTLGARWGFDEGGNWKWRPGDEVY